MKDIRRFALPCTLGALFLLFLLLVRTVDVAPVGAAGTRVGLSHLNKVVFDALGVHMFWYHLTQALGVAALLTAAAFALLGLTQLIRGKSLRKVDPCLLWLGGLYAVVLALYALFEKAVVNYRPILMPGNSQPEASFPSSHTMLVCVVMGSAFLLLPRCVRNRSAVKALRVVCLLVLVVTVCGRLLSGVHWFTDIIGGVLLSAALLTFYAAAASPARYPLRKPR